MKNRYFFLFLLIGIISSCDSGDIYPSESDGRDIDVTLTLNGVSTIPTPRKGTSKYERKLALLYYKDFNLKLTPIVAHIKAGDVVDNAEKIITIKGADKESGNVVLAIIGENDEIIYSFGKKAIGEDEQTTTLDWGDKVNLTTFDRVQAQLFDVSCTMCHGNDGAKGLSLTSSKSYSALINKDSKTDPSKKLVNPNDAINSMIYMRLTQEYDAASHVDHRSFTSLKDTDIDLLKEWINIGATKD